MSMNYVQVYSHEVFGEKGYGMKITIAGLELNETERSLCARAAEKLEEELLLSMTKRDPLCVRQREYCVARLSALFPTGSVFHVGIVDNEYNGRWVSPWIVAYTSKGVVRVGWRKRVIQLDWSGLYQVDGKEAVKLFLYEDVTRGLYSIHAWSEDKAREYLEKVLS